MKKYLLITSIFCGLIAAPGSCQIVDTLIDVGGYRLHFRIIKNKGMPILFENGSGADVTMWDPILQPLSDITAATLITYDRAGFGKSELDSTNQDIDQHGILHGIEGLETGLKKLGYDGNKILVASSFGGFCATLYAARHPATVKAAVWVDINHVSWFTDTFVEAEMNERKRNSEIIKNQSLSSYYQQLNLQNTIELMRKTAFPKTIPVIDLVSEFNFPDSASSVRWRDSHTQFAAEQPNRESIFAYGCGHIIFRDNPLLVISAIVKAYEGTLAREQGDELMKRFLSYTIKSANDDHREDVRYRRSIDNLMAWGSSLLQQGDTKMAIAVFSLGVTLFPESAVAYQQLAEAYVVAGEKKLAIKNFKQSLQMDPDNTSAKDRLKKLLSPTSK